jgi:hypothetical protein
VVRLTKPMGHHPNRVIAALHWPRSPRLEHLGYAGCRVLVSRKWSGNTIKDHRGDRKVWLIATLGLEPPDRPVHLAKRVRTIHGRVGVERGDSLDVAQRPGATSCLPGSGRRSLDPCPRFKQNAQLAY